MTFSVFKNINTLAGKFWWLDTLAIFCANGLIYLMSIFLLVAGLVAQDWKIVFWPALSGLFAAFVISKIIYLFYIEHRPAELTSTKVLIAVPKNPSFPSRHASILFGISFCLFFYNTPLAIVFIILSCFVGIARVFCGVHWFRDILGGIAAGLLSAILINYLSINL